MGLLDRARAATARQLRQPKGIRGRLVMRGLNRGNRDVVLAAVAATGLAAGKVSADIGFGGGVGLRPLLDRVGPEGHVHGVELSATALAMARRRFGSEIAEGRLSLRAGDLADLPLPDDSLDAVITVNTVYFVADLSRAFSELGRVVRPGGRAIIGIGDPVTMSAMPVTEYGFALRPVNDLVTVLRSSGFGEVADERVGSGLRGFHILVANRAHSG